MPLGCVARGTDAVVGTSLGGVPEPLRWAGPDEANRVLGRTFGDARGEGMSWKLTEVVQVMNQRTRSCSPLTQVKIQELRRDPVESM